MKKVMTLVVLIALLTLLSAQAAWAKPSPAGPIVHIVRWGENLISIARRYGVTVHAIALGDVGLDTDDGLDAGLVGTIVELDRPEHVAVVGERDGRHVGGLGGVDDVAEAICAVEEAELAVEM